MHLCFDVHFWMIGQSPFPQPEPTRRLRRGEAPPECDPTGSLAIPAFSFRVRLEPLGFLFRNRLG